VRARVCACVAALTESACSPFHRSTSASSAALRAAAAASSASSSAARRFSSASICSCGPDAAARCDAEASACDCASACARRRSSSSLDADARRCTAISAAIPFDMLWSCTAQRGRLHRAGAAEHARGVLAGSLGALDVPSWVWWPGGTARAHARAA